MTLTSGIRLGPYEIVSPIGAGGMGEVYRARDTKLHRDVAIKVLPEEFASDPERLARFEREAKLLASLNHPNIASIHGFEESDGVSALVLEFVEGPTLAERIAEGPIPVDEALAIAKQIAEALEAGHEAGVIHRDLKPANIKLKEDGTVKVLDYGLAKALEGETPSGADSELSQSPTLTRGTQVGVILGTAAYMSPEQAKGQTVDKRTDIFSFGVVLYEMLTAKRAFAGEGVPDVLAAIIRAEPDWKELPANLHPSLMRLLRRCFTKDRKNRLRDIGEARFAVQEILASPDTQALNKAEERAPILAWAIAGVLGLGLILSIWSPWQAEVLPLPVLRLSVDLGEDIQYYQGRGQSVAISPDGEMLAFAGVSSGGGSRIYIRTLDSLEVTPLAGTEGAMDPFFSPDSQWLGFFTARALKKVSVSGGGAQTIADLPNAWGGTWGPDDTIVYTPTATSGLYRVPASGGTPVELTTLEDGETTHRWPWFLPNGKAVLFAVSTTSFREATIEAVLLETGERKVLNPGGASPRFATSGHLLYVRDETMFAMPFDADRVEPVGEPIPVIEGVPVGPAGEGNFAIAENGSLVYDPSAVSQTARTLVWVDRQGREKSLTVEPQAYNEFTLSPDGTQLAVRIGALGGENPDVWVYDLVRGTRTRLTFDRGTKRFPLWTPDGQRVAFGGNGIPISWKAADGTGEVEPLVDRPTRQYPQGFSPDGSLLVFEDQNAGGDLGVLSMKGERSSKMLLQTEFAERNATLSPDGRWVAYQSDESGQDEIYVRTFPDVDTRRFPVSNDGGKWPLWGPDGRELFYFGPEGLMGVAVETGPTFALGRREVLFDAAPYLTRGGNRRVAIHPDGDRFLLLKELEAATDNTGPRGVVLVLNWFEELKRLVPTD